MAKLWQAFSGIGNKPDKPHIKIGIHFKIIQDFLCNIKIEPSHEKTNNLGFQPGPRQTDLSQKQARTLKFWI